MNITSDIIAELTDKDIGDKCAYLYALLRQRGEISYRAGKEYLTVDSMYGAVVSHAAGMIKDLLDCAVDIGRKSGDKPYYYFTLEGAAADDTLCCVRMSQPDKTDGYDAEGYYIGHSFCDYARGLFVGGGTLGAPSEDGDRGYLAEIRMWDPDSAVAACEAFNRLGVAMELTQRKTDSVLSTRKGEEAYNLLVLIGATDSALALQNLMLEQDTRALANRRSNFEIHNLQKSVDSAVEQTEAITYLAQRGLTASFSEEDRSILECRMNNRTASSAEIAAMLGLSKSKVFRRLQKAIDIAKSEGMRDE